VTDQQSVTRAALATAFAQYERDRQALGTGASSDANFDSLDLTLAEAVDPRESERVKKLFAQQRDR
jgi:hypothetical protein